MSKQRSKLFSAMAFLMLSTIVSYGQSSGKADRPIASETLRDCKKCTSERLSLYEVIREQKLIIVQQELKLGAKDTTIEMQGRVFRATEKELKKQMRKEKRKSFFKGAATGAGAALLIWFLVKN